VSIQIKIIKSITKMIQAEWHVLCIYIYVCDMQYMNNDMNHLSKNDKINKNTGFDVYILLQ
jgi:hypothetical protein